jgi:hypothetical protein
VSVFDLAPLTPLITREEPILDEAELAAVAFLARSNGHTFESCRNDLRQCFQWCHHVAMTLLAATRTHIGALSVLDGRTRPRTVTVDRRLSTVCGYYRFAHIDGRVPSNPAQYVRRPGVDPATKRGMDRAELASFLYVVDQTEIAVGLWPACRHQPTEGRRHHPSSTPGQHPVGQSRSRSSSPETACPSSSRTWLRAAAANRVATSGRDTSVASIAKMLWSAQVLAISSSYNCSTAASDAAQKFVMSPPKTRSCCVNERCTRSPPTNHSAPVGWFRRGPAAVL